MQILVIFSSCNIGMYVKSSDYKPISDKDDLYICHERGIKKKFSSSSSSVYECAAWSIQYYHFIKNSIIFFLKVGKLVEPVLDIGREFQILGPS